MNPVEAADLSVEGLAADSRPLVVLATAPWCHHCRALKPRLAEVLGAAAAPTDGRAAPPAPGFLEIDVDRHPELARRLRILALPTLMLRRDGREVARRVGAPDRAELAEWLATARDGRPLAPHTLFGPGHLDRTLRLLAGLGLIAAALLTNRSPWLLAGGALLLAWALYDRCPLIRSLLAPPPRRP